MGYRTVIIGLGRIAQYHFMGLKQTEQFSLCGVCDLKKETADDVLWRELPFYEDYNDLLDTLRPDVAVIATPPATHYAITKACVVRGVMPFVEKPLAAAKEEGEKFFTDELRGKYVPVCHTLYGPEILWLAEHMPLREIATIRMTLCDPYADADGHIAETYKCLGGSWLDSAPNALAPLLQWVPALEDVVVRHRYDPACGLPYSSLLKARHEKTDVVIDIAWQRGINHKQTEIEAEGKHIVIDHSAQAVVVDGKEVFKAEGDRLTQQYANFYRLYPTQVPDEKRQKEMYGVIWGNG